MPIAPILVQPSPARGITVEQQRWTARLVMAALAAEDTINSADAAFSHRLATKQTSTSTHRASERNWLRPLARDEKGRPARAALVNQG